MKERNHLVCVCNGMKNRDYFHYGFRMEALQTVPPPHPHHPKVLVAVTEPEKASQSPCILASVAMPGGGGCSQVSSRQQSPRLFRKCQLPTPVDQTSRPVGREREPLWWVASGQSSQAPLFPGAGVFRDRPWGPDRAPLRTRSHLTAGSPGATPPGAARRSMTPRPPWV